MTRRSANEPPADTPIQAAPIASTTCGPARMLPWAAQPSPAMPPAQGMHSGPVNVAARPTASTHTELAEHALGIVGGQGLDHAVGAVAGTQRGETLVAVAQVVERLGGDGPDRAGSPWHVGADAHRLRRDGDAPLRGRGVEGDDRVRHGAVAAAAWSCRICHTIGSSWPTIVRSS